MTQEKREQKTIKNINLSDEKLADLGLSRQAETSLKLSQFNTAPCLVWDEHSWTAICRENFPKLEKGRLPMGFVDRQGNIHLLKRDKNTDAIEMLEAYFEEEAHRDLGFSDSSRGTGSSEFFTKVNREAKMALADHIPLAVEDILGEVVANYSDDRAEVLRSWKCALSLVPGMDLDKVWQTADFLRRHAGLSPIDKSDVAIYEAAMKQLNSPELVPQVTTDRKRAAAIRWPTARRREYENLKQRVMLKQAIPQFSKAIEVQQGLCQKLVERAGKAKIDKNPKRLGFLRAEIGNALMVERLMSDQQVFLETVRIKVESLSVTKKFSDLIRDTGKLIARANVNGQIDKALVSWQKQVERGGSIRDTVRAFLDKQMDTASKKREFEDNEFVKMEEVDKLIDDEVKSKSQSKTDQIEKFKKAVEKAVGHQEEQTRS